MSWKIISICIALGLALFFLPNLGCENNDDDDDQSSDDDVITADGCHYTIDGSEESAASVSPYTLQTADYEDCIPELPDEDLREPLIFLLDAYLGDYVDDEDEPKQILCRPEGEWELPYWEAELFCDYSYRIPVWVVVDENGTTVEGKITNGDASIDNLLNNSGRLNFSTDNDAFTADRKRETTPIQWQFWGPDGPPYWGGEYIFTWTKVE